MLQPQPVAQTDWAQLILLGNDIALQWYSATQDKPIPEPQYIPGTPIPTGVARDMNTMIILGLVVVAVVVLSR